MFLYFGLSSRARGLYYYMYSSFRPSSVNRQHKYPESPLSWALSRTFPSLRMQNANGYKRWVSCGAHAGLCSLVYNFSPSSGSHIAKMS